MQYKLNVEVQFNDETISVKTDGTITGSIFDPSIEYDNTKMFWKGKNVTELMKAIGEEDKVLDKVDEQLINLHFATVYAETETEQYQEN